MKKIMLLALSTIILPCFALEWAEVANNDYGKIFLSSVRTTEKDNEFIFEIKYKNTAQLETTDRIILECSKTDSSGFHAWVNGKNVRISDSSPFYSTCGNICNKTIASSKH